MKPYADAWRGYVEKGWLYPIPLGRAGRRALKFPPPDDTTGWKNPPPEPSEVQGWASSHAANNIGLRMPENVIGVDVDDYDDKHGAEQLTELEKELGKLPASPRSTSRGADNPSGIRFFSIEPGTRLKGNAAPDIEFIQHGHRYAVAWPSVHPDTKDTYQWLDRHGEPIEIPRVDRLKPLPGPWIARFDATKTESKARAALDDVVDFTELSSKQVTAWLGEHGSGKMCRAVKGVAHNAENALDDDEGKREASHYDTARDAVYALVQLAVEGHRGVRVALRLVGEAYADYIATKNDRDPTEWARMVDGAVSKGAAIIEADLVQHEDGKCPDRPGIDSSDIWPSPTDPTAVARRWLASSYPLVDGAYTLRHWRGDFYRYTGTRWVTIGDATITAGVWMALEAVSFWSAANPPVLIGWHPTPQKVSGVVKALAALTHTPDEVEPDQDGMVSLANGALDVANNALKPHTPNRFNLSALPFTYDPDSPASSPKRWLAFLDEVLDDRQSAALLQEWFGYVISGRTDAQKLMYLVGPSRSGKGTIVRVLEALLGGAKEIATPTSAALSTNFGLSTIIGKALAVVQDASFSGRNGSMVVEQLKTLTGGDVVQIDRKNRDPWVGHPGARWMLVSNEIIGLVDPSGALLRRILGPIETVRERREKELDWDLDNKLAIELPGILGWALEGYRRFDAASRFTAPKIARDLRADMAEMMSPVRAFVEAVVEYVGDPAETECPRTPIGEVYARYAQWCADNGMHSVNSSRFGRDLRAAFGIERWRVRVDGERIWVYPIELTRPGNI